MPADTTGDEDHHHQQPNLRHSRSSIDESLELEHALAQAEGDVPPSPSVASILDPQILADLIVHLRTDLTNMTTERDELVTELAASQTREAELHDALDQSREGRKNAEDELEKLRRSHQEDTDAIGVLRTQVQESRRALMRLQSEATSARRNSAQFQLGGPLALDLSGARSPPTTTSKSAKRMSFTPMTGSLSPPPPLKRNPSDESTSSESIDAHSLISGLPNESSQLTARGRRFPSLSASPGATGRSPPRESLLNPLGAELEAMRRELVEARTEANQLRAELRDAKESRMASEAVAAALREFIASSALDAAVSPGGLGMSLPPLPSDAGVNEVGDEKPKAAWGLKLWRKDTGAAVSSPHQSTPSIASSTRRKSDASTTTNSDTASRSGFWGKTVASTPSPATTVPPKKFGFLWGTPASADVPPAPALSPPGSSSDGPFDDTLDMESPPAHDVEKHVIPVPPAAPIHTHGPLGSPLATV